MVGVGCMGSQLIGWLLVREGGETVSLKDWGGGVQLVVDVGLVGGVSVCWMCSVYLVCIGVLFPLMGVQSVSGSVWGVGVHVMLRGGGRLGRKVVRELVCGSVSGEWRSD